jgi:hypothetical protein
MYHPDKYKHHNNAEKKFSSIFNDTSNESSMVINDEENFREDGYIVYHKLNYKIMYDFEKRFTYYDSYKKFRFDTFGQFERKIKKPEIKLSIQCSKKEDAFIIAWHEDFKKENIAYINSKTKYGYERTGKRFTKRFIEISYSNMLILHNIIKKACESKKLDSSSF